jgi:hypothetical protein
VEKAVRYLKALTTMVAADYVKVFPTNRFFEPLQQIPFTYSRTGFVERVPRELVEFFHSNAVVFPDGDFVCSSNEQNQMSFSRLCTVMSAWGEILSRTFARILRQALAFQENNLVLRRI